MIALPWAIRHEERRIPPKWRMAMKNQCSCCFLAHLLIVCLLLTGCYSFIGRDDGPPFYSGDEPRYFERLIYDNRTKPGTDFTYQVARDDELRVVGADPGVKAEVLTLPLLLRFVWFSDVQLRQREVKLFSKRLSRKVDDVIPSFEHHFLQEDFDWAVYLSHVEAANRLHRDRPLDFMIHTGDCIDAGTVEELYQFIYISDQLIIPWINLVGNHDVAIFGNYEERLGYTRQAGVHFYPVGNLSNFVWMHRKDRMISGFGRHLLPTPSEGGHSPSEDFHPGKKLPPTFHHGFDFELSRSCTDYPPERLDYEGVTGFYAADLCGTSIPIRLIALNSAKTDEWGADGRISQVQRQWLKGALLPGTGGINLVFVHHRPLEFDAETRALLAGTNHGPMVVFTGHNHEHHLKYHAGHDAAGYYELNTGSVLEYPQIGRVIELRGNQNGQVWLVSRALWNSHIALPGIPQEDEVDEVLAGMFQGPHSHTRRPVRSCTLRPLRRLRRLSQRQDARLGRTSTVRGSMARGQHHHPCQPMTKTISFDPYLEPSETRSQGGKHAKGR